MSSEPTVIIFDFDGVILESVHVKAHAFSRLFEHHPNHVEAIVELHLRLAGVSRFEKFKLIHADILELPLDDTELERLGAEFSRLALEEILRCPFVPGAREFLKARHRTHRLFIASAAPEAELRHIIRERKLESFFEGVYGTPAAKADITKRVLADTGVKPQEAVFVGDAITDLNAARDAGVPFIGRVPPGDRNPFDGVPVPVVSDLGELAREWPRIRGGLAARSVA